MLITWNLLNDLLSIPASVEEVAERLTLTGCEVESMKRPGEKLKGIKIARVNSLDPHPEKETLWVAFVDDGEGEASVVTAAPNLSPGDKVPWGRPGAVLADGTVLGERDFGSARSEGMLLSAAELGVPEAADEFGILRLPEEAPLGEDAAGWLGLDDVVLDLSVTPNRGDLLSLLGVAREVYALFPGSEWKKNPADLPDRAGVKPWPVPFEGITLRGPGCTRYCLGLVTGLSGGASPLRVRIALSLLGMRPISPMVDATNLAMLTLGQPTHAFDARRLPAPEITVRGAAKGEEFTTLDGKKHVLDEEEMLITSGDVPVGIAGVMGGENSEILPETTTVFIESASFDSLSVSRTSRRLGIASEAAFRYARIVDREMAPVALKYIFSLLAEWSAGTGDYAILDNTSCPADERTVLLSRAMLRKVLLTDDLNAASAILNRLGITEQSSSGEERLFSVPSWRPDIRICEDLIEEVGRIRGYNETLAPRLPQVLYGRGDVGSVTRLKGDLRKILLARGYVELLNYSFLSPNFISLLRLPEEDRRARPLSLANPLSAEQSKMRTTLLPGLLRSVERSVLAGWRTGIRVFELGRVFLPLSEGGHEEVERVAGLVYGGRDGRLPWGQTGEEDFFSLKADVLTLGESRGICFDFLQGREPFGHEGQTARILSGGKDSGYLLRLKPAVEKELDCAPLYAFEFDLEILEKPVLPAFHELTPYPPVLRDISLFVPADSSVDEVISRIRASGEELLRNVRLFDIYSGKGVPEGFRSLAFSLTYQKRDQTLTDEAVEEVHGKIRNKLTSFGYTLR